MIVHLPDGGEVSGTIDQLSVGYQATMVILEPRDVSRMRELLKHNPLKLSQILAQLEVRFYKHSVRRGKDNDVL